MYKALAAFFRRIARGDGASDDVWNQQALAELVVQRESETSPDRAMKALTAKLAADRGDNVTFRGPDAPRDSPPVKGFLRRSNFAEKTLAQRKRDEVRSRGKLHRVPKA